MIDSHTHSIHSHDGKATIKSLVKEADRKGLEYFAITEHLDKDYQFGKMEKLCRQLDLPLYKKHFNKVKQQYKGNTYIAFGIECGYDKRLEDYYNNIIETYDFDVVINSVHTLNGIEAYYGDIFKNTTQDEVYNKYLDTLIDCASAKYNFNIVSHIGYITRYANYQNNLLYQDRFKSKIDTLLKIIIDRDKTLEVNTHINTNGLQFLPEVEILQRYYDLGGRNITFSSDAHKYKFVADKYDIVKKVVKEIGFTKWTVYKKQQPFKIGID